MINAVIRTASVAMYERYYTPRRAINLSTGADHLPADSLCISDGAPESGGGGGSMVAPPVAAADDDDGGDPDPEPERPRTGTRSNSAARRNATATVGDLRFNPPSSELALWRLPTVLAHVPVCRSSWWAGIKTGRYPAPVKLGARSVAWRAADIRALIDSL